MSFYRYGDGSEIPKKKKSMGNLSDQDLTGMKSQKVFKGR
jgi:hypothetical protein